jgi:bifunctional DNA-binding transcriptional regulator/antitoxin component of YhaV-PrlF toxin-antitoxin module
VDDRGRIADYAIVRALGWRAGTRLDIRVIGGLIVVTAGDAGAWSVTNLGHVRLPVAVRRCCGVEPGDRVLLAAEPAEGVLAVHPPTVMDTMLARFHAQVMAGDAT